MKSSIELIYLHVVQFNNINNFDNTWKYQLHSLLSYFARKWYLVKISLVDVTLIATTLPGPGQCYKLYLCFCNFHAQAACLGKGKERKLMYYLQRCTRWRIHNVSNNTLICVTFICPGMPGQESIKNRCIICNVVLGQVTLSQ